MEIQSFGFDGCEEWRCLLFFTSFCFSHFIIIIIIIVGKEIMLNNVVRG